MPADPLLATDLAPVGAGRLAVLQRHRAGLPPGRAPPLVQFGPDGVVRAVRANVDASRLQANGPATSTTPAASSPPATRPPR